MKNETLDKLIEEGFVDTGRKFADLKIYKTKQEFVLYDDKKQSVYLRYNNVTGEKNGAYKKQ